MDVEDRLRSAAIELRHATRDAVRPGVEAQPRRGALAVKGLALVVAAATVGAFVWAMTGRPAHVVSVGTSGSGAASFQHATVTSATDWNGETFAAGWVGGKDCRTATTPSCAAQAGVWSEKSATWKQMWTSPVIGVLGLVVPPGGFSAIGPNGAPASVALVPAGPRLYLFASTAMGSRPATAAWASADGTRWTPELLPSAVARAALMSVTYGHGRLVVTTSPIFGSTQSTWTSTDRGQWKPVAIPDATPPDKAGDFTTVGAGTATSRGFVLAGHDRGDRPAVWSSPDGRTWRLTDVTTQSGYVDALGTEGTTVVAVAQMAGAPGGDRRIYVTREGRSWFMAHLNGSLPSAGRVLAVLTGPDGFVLVLYDATSAGVDVWSSNPAGTEWYPDNLAGLPNGFFQVDSATLTGPDSLLLFGSTANSGDQPTSVTFTAAKGTTAGPTTLTTSATTPTTTASLPAQPPPVCQQGQIQGRLEGIGGAAGNWAAGFWIADSSTQPCMLAGPAGIQLLNGSGQAQLTASSSFNPIPLTANTPVPSDHVVTTGTLAYLSLFWPTDGSFAGGSCPTPDFVPSAARITFGGTVSVTIKDLRAGPPLREVAICGRHISIESVGPLPPSPGG